ncbi:hypothetical protein Tco_0983616 [Tanacetum coccineum]
MLTQELFKGYDRKSGPKRVAVKDSVNVLKEYEFGKVAGLIPNYNKSTIIFGSLNDDEKNELLAVMPFKVENLPIRYLGVPLTSKKLRAKEFIEDINKLLKNFLWQQFESFKGRAKVVWKNICKYKQKGGLGLKDLRVWNKAIIVKHLWHIVNDTESLWVKWIHTEKLRGRSVSEVDIETNDSWGWKNIFNLRKDARKFMFLKIGDGNRTLIWPILNEHVRDNVVWKRENGKLCKFSVKQAYEDLLEVTEDVEWWKMIWLSQNIPKNSINSIIRRISLAASVYMIWQERNNRIFRDEMRNPDEIYKILEDIIRMRLLSLKVKNSVAVKKAQEIWNVKMNIIDSSDLQLIALCILESTGCGCTH